MNGLEKAIKKAGTASNLATLLGIKPMSVSRWKNRYKALFLTTGYCRYSTSPALRRMSFARTSTRIQLTACRRTGAIAMHSISLQQTTGFQQGSLIPNYQNVPRNNNMLTHMEAVRAGTKPPGVAVTIAVSARGWIARGGRGLLLVGSKHNVKQNFFRMINTPGPKKTQI
jgi:hypothetical protein